MATITVLTEAERIVLPFSALAPVAVGALGYWVWKRDRARGDELMTERMAAWFVADCAIVLGLALFHVVRNLTVDALDYRIGMGAFGLSFMLFVAAAMFGKLLRISDADDILLNERNEQAAFVLLTTDAVQQRAHGINQAASSMRRRRIISGLTYLAILFQSSFDGMVLAYNPNAQDSALQVAMFFLSKALESAVVSSALIHSGIRARYYVFCMGNFTVAVAMSTLAAYGIVPPLVLAAVFEHWLFQVALGCSGGLLLMLGFYYINLESKRHDYIGSRPLLMSLVFSVAFSGAALTGMFG